MNNRKEGSAGFYTNHQHTVNIFLITAVSFIVFYNSLSNYFLEVDDFNIMLHTKRSLPGIFFTNTYGGATGGNYRPFEVLSHLTDTILFGDENPYGRHIVNLFLHVSNGILIYILGFLLSKKKFVALGAALLFVVHIIHSNVLSPVTWISGRIDMLVTFFYLLAVVLFLESLEKRSFVTYFISLAAFILALMSKEMAVTLPVIILLYVVLNNSENNKGHELLSSGTLSVFLKVFISAGVLILLAGLVFSSSFLEYLFSSDGKLKETTIQKINSARYIAIAGGTAVTLFGTIPYLLKNSRRFSFLLSRVNYAIPYFLVLFLFMTGRFILLGGVGGAYKSGEGNVIFQIGPDAFARDILALPAFFWPLDIDYNLDVFNLQIYSPLLFYLLSISILSVLIYLAYRFLKWSKLVSFSYFWIFITLIPVHNVLVPSWQFQSKYFYLPLAGFCLLIPLLLYRWKESIKLSPGLYTGLASGFILLIIIFSAGFIIKTNDKKAESGELMRTFVSDIKEHHLNITENTSLYFLSFPISQISSGSCMYVNNYLDDLLRFCDPAKNYRKSYNHDIVSFVEPGQTGSLKTTWSGHRCTIEGINPDEYFYIPSTHSLYDDEIEGIYKVVPHHCLKQLGRDKKGEILLTEGKIELEAAGSEKYEKNKADLIVDLSGIPEISKNNNLFFIYEEGRFRLVKY